MFLFFERTVNHFFFLQGCKTIRTTVNLLGDSGQLRTWKLLRKRKCVAATLYERLPSNPQAAQKIGISSLIYQAFYLLLSIYAVRRDNSADVVRCDTLDSFAELRPRSGIDAGILVKLSKHGTCTAVFSN